MFAACVANYSRIVLCNLNDCLKCVVFILGINLVLGDQTVVNLL